MRNPAMGEWSLLRRDLEYGRPNLILCIAILDILLFICVAYKWKEITYKMLV
jgi:hypothetical protein